CASEFPGLTGGAAIPGGLTPEGCPARSQSATGRLESGLDGRAAGDGSAPSGAGPALRTGAGKL
ncbi:MAG: hypothetical protein ACKVVP_13285, partial [Chloroflexota bacterium]